LGVEVLKGWNEAESEKKRTWIFPQKKKKREESIAPA
jgi:hypothetical protein